VFPAGKGDVPETFKPFVYGAAKLAIGLGLGPALATLACIAAFLCNFLMIET
jgi:hypothetical protein